MCLCISVNIASFELVTRFSNQYELDCTLFQPMVLTAACFVLVVRYVPCLIIYLPPIFLCIFTPLNAYNCLCAYTYIYVCYYSVRQAVVGAILTSIFCALLLIN